MTQRQQVVLDKIKELGEASPHEVAISLGFSESAWIYSQIRYLKRNELIESIGKGKQNKLKLK